MSQTPRHISTDRSLSREAGQAARARVRLRDRNTADRRGVRQRTQCAAPPPGTAGPAE